MMQNIHKPTDLSKYESGAFGSIERMTDKFLDSANELKNAMNDAKIHAAAY